MPGFEIYGRVIDPFSVKLAVRETLQAWMPGHLANQADRYGLPASTFPAPRSWPKGIDDWDPAAAATLLPSVVIVQHGGQGNPKRNERGEYMKTWQFDIRAAVAASSEEDAEKLGSVYLAAMTSALMQNGTLGGLAYQTVDVGPDSYTIGGAGGPAKGATRAVYGSIFAVTVRNVVSDMAGPTSPPADPAHPPAQFGGFTDTDVTVTSIPLEGTP